MFKTTFFKVFLLGAVIIALGALLYAGFYRPTFAPAVITNEEVTSDEPNVENTSKTELAVPEDLIESGPTAGYTLAFSDEKQTLWIYKDGTLLESIPVNTLPARAGSGDSSENDYEYYVYLNKSIPTVYDSNSKRIYFVSINQTLSGNRNGMKTLYGYDVVTQKVSEIYSVLTAGLDDLTASPNGTYLVFTAGAYAGYCGNFYDLAVFDLSSGDIIQHTASPKFTGGTTGFATFLKWESDTAFTYEDYYMSVDECLKSGGVDYSTVEDFTLRTHKIK